MLKQYLQVVHFALCIFNKLILNYDVEGLEKILFRITVLTLGKCLYGFKY